MTFFGSIEVGSAATGTLFLNSVSAFSSLNISAPVIAMESIDFMNGGQTVITSGGSLSLTSNSFSIGDHTLTIQNGGQFNLYDASLTMNDGAMLSGMSGSVMVLQSNIWNGNSIGGAPPLITTAGSILFTGSSMNINVSLSTVSGSNAEIAVSSTAGNIDFSGPSLLISAGTTMTLNGGIVTLETQEFSLMGSLNVVGGSVLYVDSWMLNGSVTVNDNGLLQFVADCTVFGNVTIQGSGTVESNYNLLVIGVVEQSGNSVLHLSGSNATITGSLVQVDGSKAQILTDMNNQMIWTNSSTISLGSSSMINGSLIVQTPSVTGSGKLVVSGVTNITAPSTSSIQTSFVGPLFLAITDGVGGIVDFSYVISSSNVIQVANSTIMQIDVSFTCQSGCNVGGGSSGGSLVISKGGSLIVSSSASTIDLPTTVYGTVSILQGAQLSVSNQLTLVGSSSQDTVSGLGTLECLTTATTTFNGPSTLTISIGNLTLSGSLVVNTAVELNGGSVTFDHVTSLTGTTSGSLTVNCPISANGLPGSVPFYINSQLTIFGIAQFSPLISFGGSEGTSSINIPASQQSVSATFTGGLIFNAGTSLSLPTGLQMTISTNPLQYFSLNYPMVLNRGSLLLIENGQQQSMINQSVTGGGQLTVSAGASLILTNSTVSVSNLTVDGTLIVSSSVIQLLSTQIKNISS